MTTVGRSDLDKTDRASRGGRDSFNRDRVPAPRVWGARDTLGFPCPDALPYRVAVKRDGQSVPRAE